MLSKILRSAVLATFAVGATVAQAELGQLTFSGTKHGFGVNLWKEPLNTAAPWVNGGSYSAGLFYGKFDPDGANPSEDITFFCIDLGAWANAGPNSYERNLVIPSAGDDVELRNLFASYVWPTSYGGSNKDRYAAAMQLAIWNILYDTDSDVSTFGPTSDKFRSSPDNDTKILANQMMSQAKNPTTVDGLNNIAGYDYTLIKYHSDGYQDFIAFTRAGKEPPPRLPLPGTLALLGIGLAGLGLARRKS